MRKSIVFWCLVGIAVITVVGALLKRRDDQQVRDAASNADASPAAGALPVNGNGAAAQPAAPSTTNATPSAQTLPPIDADSWPTVNERFAAQVREAKVSNLPQMRPGANPVRERIDAMDDLYQQLEETQVAELAVAIRSAEFLGDDDKLINLLNPTLSPLLSTAAKKEIQTHVDKLQTILNRISEQRNGALGGLEAYFSGRRSDRSGPPMSPSKVAPTYWDVWAFQRDAKHALVYTDISIDELAHEVEAMFTVIARRSERAKTYDADISAAVAEARAIVKLQNPNGSNTLMGAADQMRRPGDRIRTPEAYYSARIFDSASIVAALIRQDIAAATADQLRDAPGPLPGTVAKQEMAKWDADRRSRTMATVELAWQRTKPMAIHDGFLSMPASGDMRAALAEQAARDQKQAEEARNPSEAPAMREQREAQEKKRAAQEARQQQVQKMFELRDALGLPHNPSAPLPPDVGAEVKRLEALLKEKRAKEGRDK